MHGGVDWGQRQSMLGWSMEGFDLSAGGAMAMPLRCSKVRMLFSGLPTGEIGRAHV